MQSKSQTPVVRLVVWACCGFVVDAAPGSEVEAIVRSPTNMAAAKISAVDFMKMTSLDRPACSHDTERWSAKKRLDDTVACEQSQ